MSNQALDLLIECELLRANGSVVDIDCVPNSELSRRYSAFVSARKKSMYVELEAYDPDTKLNAQFSTWSSKLSKERILSSLLVYNRTVADDPLVSAQFGISMSDLKSGLEFYSWAHPLIRAGLVIIYPIDYYVNPSLDIPMLYSEDSFRSSISPVIHNYAHANAILKSVVPGENGSMLVLAEEASVTRRTALSVQFENDRLYSGVGLFKFTTIDNFQRDGERLAYEQQWDKDGVLSEDKFKHWAYQATNQAVMARLKAISNQVSLAQKLGHTYITESEFESTLLSLSNEKGAERISPCMKFLDVNDKFLNFASPTVITDLRDKHSAAFDRFNSSLVLVCDELHGVNEEDFESKSRVLFEREIRPQVDLVRSAIGKVQSDFISGTAISLCGVAMAIATGSLVPLVSTLALSVAQGLSTSLPAVREVQLIKTRPSYIWHRVTQ
jgi:hypothetical protein